MARTATNTTAGNGSVPTGIIPRCPSSVTTGEIVVAGSKEAGVAFDFYTLLGQSKVRVGETSSLPV